MDKALAGSVAGDAFAVEEQTGWLHFESVNLWTPSRIET